MNNLQEYNYNNTEADKQNLLKLCDKAELILLKNHKNEQVKRFLINSLLSLMKKEHNVNTAIFLAWRAKRWDNTNLEVLHFMGMSYMKIQQYKQAEMILQESLASHIKSAKAWISLINCYYAQHKYMQASNLLESAFHHMENDLDNFKRQLQN